MKDNHTKGEKKEEGEGDANRQHCTKFETLYIVTL